MENFFNKFRLHSEKEEFQHIFSGIDNGVAFKGTNLWVLILAIFVASLGLNLNSTAVIIGAMLISPLMGPIMGIGLGLGINDITLLRKALYNYCIATGVALATSTLFFLLSPLNDAHSEILARTSPTIYDVLIALFGGLAGILAVSSKQKGNVIPGVAIATALMPPLCTAGYGLATLNFKFFYGAFYLFIINTVFIALATFIISRLLHFPYRRLHNERSEKAARRIVWGVVLLTLIPSLYFGYDMVQQNKFVNRANRFVNNEAHFANDYLLNKKIDGKNKTITLIFGGKEITDGEIAGLKMQMAKYGIDSAKLEVKQGFAYLADNNDGAQNDEIRQLTFALEQKEQQGKLIKAQQDSLVAIKAGGVQLYKELKAQYPGIKSAVIQPVTIFSDSAQSTQSFLVSLLLSPRMASKERAKLERWLEARLQVSGIRLVIEPYHY